MKTKWWDSKILKELVALNPGLDYGSILRTQFRASPLPFKVGDLVYYCGHHDNKTAFIYADKFKIQSINKATREITINSCYYSAELFTPVWYIDKKLSYTEFDWNNS